MITYELDTKQDPRKSFYGKALVSYGKENNIYLLRSYGTLVAMYSGNSDRMEVYKTHSATTLRHIKEFIFQMTEETGLTKADIEKKFIRQD